MDIISQVKTLLGLNDDLQDNVLSVIEELTESHFKAYAQQKTIPAELDYIIIEVMIKRFNRLGSEGMSSQSVEGLSMAFSLDDFAEYDKVIKRQFADHFKAGFKVL